MKLKEKTFHAHIFVDENYKLGEVIAFLLEADQLLKQMLSRKTYQNIVWVMTSVPQGAARPVGEEAYMIEARIITMDGGVLAIVSTNIITKDSMNSERPIRIDASEENGPRPLAQHVVDCTSDIPVGW